jgi:hypothetical protein
MLGFGPSEYGEVVLKKFGLTTDNPTSQAGKLLGAGKSCRVYQLDHHHRTITFRERKSWGKALPCTLLSVQHERIKERPGKSSSVERKKGLRTV